jgi:predicted small metal-binding protein
MERRKWTMPSFKCADLGMKCSFEATAKTEDELMKKIAEHGAKAHDIKKISPDMMSKIKKAIKK